MRTSSNWRSVWKHRREMALMPPIQLRSGLVLHHGPYDNPRVLVDEVFFNNWYDLRARPASDALMLDIGANIGAVSMYWLHKFPYLQVACYEPNPSACTTLRQNIDGNGFSQRAEVFSEGVGRDAGTIRLWVDIPTDLSTAYLDKSPVAGGKRVEIPRVGIDEVWQRAGKKNVWLLKVDTEGAETDILEGASPAFLASVQNAIVEYHDNIVPGSLERCRRVLESAGFQCQFRHHWWKEGIIYASRGTAAA
jgi:FkbM family methyltransferase